MYICIIEYLKQDLRRNGVLEAVRGADSCNPK